MFAICCKAGAILTCSSPHFDLYITVQLWADSKPLTVPVQTSYKSFRNERRWGDWLSLPVNYNILPLSSQLAITIWDLSPTGGHGENGHSIPFGGTTFALFDHDNTLHKGRQICYVHRHKAADGLANTTTPASLPLERPKGKGKKEEVAIDKQQAESDRLEALLKKHEMGEIQAVTWLDQLVFRTIEKQNLISPATTTKALRQKKRIQSGSGRAENGDEAENEENDENFTLHIELPRFDFPVVFADHEYPPPQILAMQSV